MGQCTAEHAGASGDARPAARRMQRYRRGSARWRETERPLRNASAVQYGATLSWELNIHDRPASSGTVSLVPPEPAS
jgi:hypothetical protein